MRIEFRVNYKAKIANYRITRKDDLIRIRPINSNRWLVESILLLILALSALATAGLFPFLNLFDSFWIIPDLDWIFMGIFVLISLRIFIYSIKLFRLYRIDRVKIDVLAQSIRHRRETFYFDEILEASMYEIYDYGLFARLRLQKHDFIKVIKIELKTYREISLFFIRGKVHQASDTYSRDIFQKTEAAKKLKAYLEVIIQSREKSVLEMEEEEKVFIKQSNVSL